MLLEISLLIIGIAFLLLVVFAIPSLLQIRRTAKSVEITSRSLNQELPSILTNMDEITTNLTNTTHTVRGQIELFSGVIDKIQEVTDDVVNFEKTIRGEIETPLIETLATLTAFVKGTRAFWDTLRTRS